MIDGKYLRFEQRQPILESYFLIDEHQILSSGLHQDIKDQLLRKRAYSTYEIDDFLGQFEDLDDLHVANTLDLRLIWSSFSFYLNSAWDNDAIQAHIATQYAEPDSEGTYDGFKSIVEKCNRYEETR